MPIIAYTCSCGNSSKKFFRQPKQAPSAIDCQDCGDKMKRILSPSSSVSKVVVDNGLQARSTEVVLETVAANQERSRKDYSKE